MPVQKFNNKTRSTIYGCLSQGNYLKTAAGVAGISYRSLLGWIKKGKQGEGEEYVNFYNEVNRIQADWEAQTVQSINEFGGAKLQLEMLSRKNPEAWASTSRTINIVNEKLEEFMDYMVEELADDQTVLKKFLEVAAQYETKEDSN